MATPVTVHAHAPQGFIRKYIFSLDHKVIGLQYFFLALTAVWVGMLLSLLMRIHMIWPMATIPLIGDIKPETYLSLMTMHGTIMVFFVLTTAPQGGFGNYVLPIQIGAPDMAFPVLNMLSFWTTFVAYVVMLAAFFVQGGAPLHGWTGYPPLSALQSAGPGEGLGADLWITSIAIFCIASLMGALNFITTTLDLRAKPLAWPGRWQCAQRCVTGPAMQWRSSGNEESGEHHDETQECCPERKHVQHGESHVRRANLNGQEVIAEAALGRGGEHEENHDGAVHRYQAEVSLRLDLAQQRQRHRGPDHVDAHQQRQEHSDKYCRQSQEIILQADDFVV